MAMADLAALRAVLAREAARRARTGQLPGTVLPRLRLLTTAELLCPGAPPARAADAAGELAALCAALGQMLRRPAGWLAADLPPGPLPVLVRPALLQGAVLCWLRGALAGGAAAVRLCCQPAGGAAVLQLLGCGMAGDAAALWRRLAAEAGGHAVFLAGRTAGAAARLPAADGLPVRPVPAPADLLADRYSLPRLYLDGFCAEPER